MRRVWQYRAVELLTRTKFNRSRQTLPRWGERRIVWVSGHLWWLLEWRSRLGWWCLERGRFERGEPVRVGEYPRPEECSTVKKRQVASGDLILPFLGRDSKLLAKLPRLCEFISATAYDDGTFRQPGYLTFRNRMTTYEITLYDPDYGLRLALRAVTIDEVLTLAEKAVDADGMPWEVDNYLTEQLSKKKPKKK